MSLEPFSVNDNLAGEVLTLEGRDTLEGEGDFFGDFAGERQLSVLFLTHTGQDQDSFPSRAIESLKPKHLG